MPVSLLNLFLRGFSVSKWLGKREDPGDEVVSPFSFPVPPLSATGKPEKPAEKAKKLLYYVREA